MAALATPAAALGANACSASVGKAVLNEYNYLVNFTEVKKLDAGIDMTGWKVTVHTHNRTASGSLPASGSNSCLGGVYQVNEFAPNQTSQNADIVLFDDNDDVVDILRVRTANPPFTTAYYSSPIPACSFVSPSYDLQVAASDKGVDRSPDGVGAWRSTPGQGAGSSSTKCGGNTPGAMPGGFNAFDVGTPAGSASGVIRTKIAAAPFSLSVVALHPSGTAVDTTFTGDVKLELVDASTGAGCGAYGRIQDLKEHKFSAADLGRKTLAGIAEPDAWPNVRLRISHPATGTPTLVACSADNFAIRPASLDVIARDADSSTAGSGRVLANASATGGNVHRAGRPFRIEATALNAAGATTANYTGSPAAALAGCVLPATGCIPGTLTAGPWSAASGVVSTMTATYSEVGSFTMKLADTGFAAVDVADGSTAAERTVESAPVTVGRFVPDHFDLAPVSVPEFRTFNASAVDCPVRPFTYVGQPFGYVAVPEATITARNAAGATTANYTGALWKLEPLGTVQTYTAITGALDIGLLGPPTVTETGGGAGTMRADPDDELAFVRSTPVAPFTADITLSMTIQDIAENSVSGNGTIDTAAPALFPGIDFDDGNQIRFGQLVLSNAHGSELLALPVPIETRHWNGTGFVLNTADSCTQLSAADVTLGNWRRDLNSPETVVSLSGRFNAGRGNLRLSRPGPGNTGSVDLTVQLDATSPPQTWLQGRWTGPDYNDNPAARASFGLHRGSNSLIYLREMH